MRRGGDPPAHGCGPGHATPSIPLDWLRMGITALGYQMGLSVAVSKQCPCMSLSPAQGEVNPDACRAGSCGKATTASGSAVLGGAVSHTLPIEWGETPHNHSRDGFIAHVMTALIREMGRVQEGRACSPSCSQPSSTSLTLSLHLQDKPWGQHMVPGDAEHQGTGWGSRRLIPAEAALGGWHTGCLEPGRGNWKGCRDTGQKERS